MIIFNLPEYRKLAEEIASAGFRLGRFYKHYFPNNEYGLILKSKVLHKDCAILGGLFPASNLLEILLLADLLKKEGARKVVVILPYLAFSRQDTNEENKSWGIETLSEIFKSSSIDKIISIDVHSKAGRKLFGRKLVSIEPLDIFSKQIRKLNLRDFSLIAPDEGGRIRVRNLAKVLQSRRFGYFIKIRQANRIKHIKYYGGITEQAIIYDDVLETGRTLISTVKQLKSLGFKDIYIFVTHGQFAGTRWQELFRLGVKDIYTTNSIALERKTNGIKVLSVSTLITKALKTLV